MATATRTFLHLSLTLCQDVAFTNCLRAPAMTAAVCGPCACLSEASAARTLVADIAVVG